jgi:hypothetical protein
MTRQEASDLLMAEKEGGVFLVRDSATIQGDYVLCVRCDSRSKLGVSAVIRVARFFFVQYTETGKIYRSTQNLPNGHM